VIWRLARAIEYRDGDTGEHVSRVALISRLLARAWGSTPNAAASSTWRRATRHRKIGIADAILGKPGRLDPAELSKMREHVTIGARILEQGSSDLIRTAELLRSAITSAGTAPAIRIASPAKPSRSRPASSPSPTSSTRSARSGRTGRLAGDRAYAEIVALSGTHFDPALCHGLQGPLVRHPRRHRPRRRPPSTGGRLLAVFLQELFARAAAAAAFWRSTEFIRIITIFTATDDVANNGCHATSLCIFLRFDCDYYS